MIGIRTQLTVALLGAAALAGRSGAQECDTVASRTSMAAFAGDTVSAVHIVTLAPTPLPGLASRIGALHVKTREGTVRRQLELAPGDTVDTLRVAESLRRLRRLRYLTDVRMTGVRCEGAPGVSLTVITRDGWSVKPSVRVRSSSESAIGLTERNLLGTGREAMVGVRTDDGRVGIGAQLDDPWFLGTALSMRAGVNQYADGSQWHAALGTREQSVLDRGGVELRVARSVREPTDGVGDVFHRRSGSLLGTRLVRAGSDAALAVVGGAEYERTSLVAAPDADLVGPGRVQREFVGVDAGVRRRAVAFDTLTWLLPHETIVDVPLAFETDVLVGVGRDRSLDATAVHLDAWAGRAWMLGQRAFAVADLWASGFASHGRVDAATLRASLSWFGAARRGIWTARLTAEQLTNPDPDVRKFTTIDPIARAFPSTARLAEGAVGATVERSARVRPLSRSWALDVAAFGAASLRWDPAVETSEQLMAGVVGMGLRLAPTRLGRATARLDVGYPVLRSADVRHGPLVAISLSPWFEQGRARDGRLEP